MGLRINTNVGALSALRNLFEAQRITSRAQERIATGLAINRASDNPAGLIISETLRSQLSGIDQATQNVQNAANFLNTAEAGLGEVGDLLVKARGLAVQALNTGVLDDDQRNALQFSLDQTLDAVDRIAGTTRFGRTPLLNGSQDFVLQNVSPELTDVRVSEASLRGSGAETVQVNVTTAAQRAQAGGTLAAAQSADSTVTIRGELGSQTFEFGAGATQQEIEDAINSASDLTGVEASGGALRSARTGSAAFVEVIEESGDLEGIAAGRTEGQDVAAVVNGQSVTGDRETFSVNGPNLRATIRVEEGATGGFSFQINGGGAGIQFAAESGAFARTVLGIPGATTALLGEPGGDTLGTLRSGGANDLRNNPAGALGVLDAAATQVSSARGQLGAATGQFLESARRGLDVAAENLSSSLSTIRDADFAREIAERARGQALIQSSIFALQQSNVSSGGVLRLLGFS